MESKLLAATIRMLLAQQALNNDSVLKLVKAGMGDDVIVGMINTQPGKYSLTTDDLISLKTAGVSQKVITAMITKGSVVATAPAVTAPVDATPKEIGVYYKKAGAWTDVDPEVVNFKSGGVLKSIATNGIIKGDMNGNLKGPHSKLEVKTPVELLIYAPEGIAA